MPNLQVVMASQFAAGLFSLGERPLSQPLHMCCHALAIFRRPRRSWPLGQ
jgi:hypothetical protein